MSNDPLMNALAQLATDEAKIDPRLEALAEGRLSTEELAGLEAEAAQDPELALALEAYRPLDGAAADRIVAAATEAFGPTSSTSAPETMDNIVPFPLRRVVGGALVAAAAVAAMFVFVPTGPDYGPLPTYGMEMIGGDARVRGAEHEEIPAADSIRVFSPTSRVELQVVPERAIEGEAAAAVYFEANGKLAPLAGKIESSEEGVFRIVGSASTLFGGHVGDVRVYFAVARRGALPSAERIREIAEVAPSDAVQVFSSELRLIPAAD